MLTGASRHAGRTPIPGQRGYFAHPTGRGILVTMREPQWSVDRLKSEIAMLGTRGLSREEDFAGLRPRRRRVINSDASCGHTLDPQPRLLTSDEPRELVEAGIYTPDTGAAAGEEVVRSEDQSDDRDTCAE